jgi:hypothetical protein
MLKTTLGSDGDKSAFKFDRATEDLYGFKDRIAFQKEERARALQTAFDEDDVDVFPEEQIDKLIAQQKFDPEEQ